MLLTGRPRHFPAAEQVKVQVRNLLATIVATVHNQTIAIIKILFIGNS